MTHLHVGYSTCPNDTYIFAGLPGLKDVSSITFDPILADVETLNGWALEKRLDITKLSFFAFGKVREHYALLHAGAALGRGCGPVLVARPGTSLSELGKGMVAAPGNLTTARLLLTLYLGKEPRFTQMVFSEVMPTVNKGEGGLRARDPRRAIHLPGAWSSDSAGSGKMVGGGDRISHPPGGNRHSARFGRGIGQRCGQMHPHFPCSCPERF